MKVITMEEKGEGDVREIPLAELKARKKEVSDLMVEGVEGGEGWSLF